MPNREANLFLSCVTDEFGSYRPILLADLGRPGVRIEIQEHFLAAGDKTLVMLDDYIQQCHAVIHLAGERTGGETTAGVATKANRKAILTRYPDLPARLNLPDDFTQSLSYAQWEAWLAVYHGKKLFICTPATEAPRDSVLSDPVKAEAQRLAQQRHLALLRKSGHYAEIPLKFPDASRLSVALLRSLHAILPPVTVPVNLLPSLGRLFKGRDTWLARLRDALRPAVDGQVDATRIALWGMGGLGKTRLAPSMPTLFRINTPRSSPSPPPLPRTCETASPTSPAASSCPSLPRTTARPACGPLSSGWTTRRTGAGSSWWTTWTRSLLSSKPRRCSGSCIMDG